MFNRIEMAHRCVMLELKEILSLVKPIVHLLAVGTPPAELQEKVEDTQTKHSHPETPPQQGIGCSARKIVKDLGRQAK